MSTEEEEEDDDEKKEEIFGRASIAALDLPIECITTSKENDMKIILHRTHSLDSGLEKIVSVATIEEIKLFSSNDSNDSNNSNGLGEEVIVPARNVLIKMPFYSTPLSIETTNNAFRDFMIRLNEMGFIEEAEAALVATHAESVESAIEFIMNNPDALFHRFQLNASCCTLPKNQHIIDSNGNKIIIVNDNNILEHIIEKEVRDKIEIITKQQQQQQDMKEEEDEEDIKQEEEEEYKQDIKEQDIKQQQEEEEEEDIDYGDVELQKCLICFTDRPLSMFYNSICGHNYCNICLSSHYRIKILDGDVLKLSCIDPSCDRLIEEKEILSLIGSKTKKQIDLRNKYIKFRRNKLLQLNPNARFCCKPDCEGIMFGNSINRKLICPKCKQSICFNCNQPWHGIFVGCNQNIDIGYTKWALNKDVQKCPKCRMGIEKDDGCNHMTCSSCKYEFCWICKGPYNDHHFEWWNIFGCPGAQYTPRFCRCPHCFPRWLNRILIILCFLAVVVPLVLTAALLWFIIICLIFCVRCDFNSNSIFDPCDCF